MFGYIIANQEIMSEEQIDRYKSVYCGLCRTLRIKHGSVSRMTLTYDMTFLIMLLSSMYEPSLIHGTERCLMHPIKKHNWSVNGITEYAASMNVAMSYLKLKDDWSDEKKATSLAMASVLSEEYFYVKQEFPEKCLFFENCLSELTALEKANVQDPDSAARTFGKLMGELFVCEKDEIWGDRLREFGHALGEFIYILDAVVDLEKDKRDSNYNPMILISESKTDEEILEILKMLISECTTKFEYLPLVQDVDILRNILYSGVWTKYMQKLGGRQQGEKKTNES